MRLPIYPLMVHFSFSFRPPSSFSSQSNSLTLDLPFLVSFSFLSFSLSNHQPTVPIFFSKMVPSFPMHAPFPFTFFKPHLPFSFLSLSFQSPAGYPNFPFLSHMEHVESHAKQMIKKKYTNKRKLRVIII